jgi:hypothetical protein
VELLRGAQSLGSLHGAGIGRRGGHGAVAREEEATLGWRGQKRKREKGHGLLGKLGARWPMGRGKKK